MRTTKIAALAVAAAIPVLGTAGIASAAIVDQYDHVTYVFCADTATASNEVSYYDSYGRREQVNVSLTEAVGGARHCGSTSYTEYDEYGGYVGSSIVNEDSTYVYCAIYNNGRKVAESEDHSTYGYSFATC
ncbi:putative secreted protein [Rhodococcus phage Mbo2]|uniref:Secreted protein n=1 Tax=Rhodococcus phage Mbo2 TaxID=2936911 RepID=A0A9E7IGX1_9CAUD|nr:putative secreted protein [Rhodococcus phage Mbo2]